MNNNEMIKDQYRIIKEIGKGSFGYVYLVEDIKNSNKRYALKRIHSNKLNESEYLLKAFKLELEVMKKCECENSVQFVEFFQTTHFHNIVMELCEGDLDSILKFRETGFTEEELKSILKQLNNVFKIMNKENIIHRDLKLKNILYIHPDSNNHSILDKEGPNFSEDLNDRLSSYKKENIHIKLTDFGFSKVLEDDITSTKLGTPATMAPEIMMHTNKGYTNKVDLWSIGVISYQLLFKRLPFTGYNEQDLLNNIRTKSLSFPESKKLSKQCQELLVKLLQIDPEKRISWKEYYEHPFFKNEIYNDNVRKNVIID
jgi:serine/threonine protein kinase